MAEGLGTGLQNLLQRFDSASHLKEVLCKRLRGTFSFLRLLIHLFLLCVICTLVAQVGLKGGSCWVFSNATEFDFGTNNGLWG